MLSFHRYCEYKCDLAYHGYVNCISFPCPWTWHTCEIPDVGRGLLKIVFANVIYKKRAKGKWKREYAFLKLDQITYNIVRLRVC